MWSTDPKIHQLCVDRILDVVSIKESVFRYQQVLTYLERVAVYPEEAGDYPLVWLATMSGYAKYPGLLQGHTDPQLNNLVTGGP